MDIAHLSEQNHPDIFGKICYSYNPTVGYYIWPWCVCVCECVQNKYILIPAVCGELAC